MTKTTAATATATNLADVSTLWADLKGVDYNEEVDGPTDPDAPSWRVFTRTAQAHRAVKSRVEAQGLVALDCSDVLDSIDREDGGLFGAYVVTLA